MNRIWLLILIIPTFAQAQYDHQDIFAGERGDALFQLLVQDFKPTRVNDYTSGREYMFRTVFNRNDTIETIYAGLERFLDPREESAIQFLLTGDTDRRVDTEHSFPRSKGADRDTEAGSNLHHLFPARQRVNSARSNVPFGEVNDAQASSWFLGSNTQSNIPGQNIDEFSELGQGRFEPRESKKGDIARAIFYFYTMYRDRAENADSEFFPLQVDDLCNWHFDDPVDQGEWERTHLIADFQDNKTNPFIIDCSLASRLYCPIITDACAFLTDVKDIEEDDSKLWNTSSGIRHTPGSSFSGTYDYVLYDHVGRNWAQGVGQDEVLIENHNLIPGMYFFTWFDGKTRRTSKIIIFN